MQWSTSTEKRAVWSTVNIDGCFFSRSTAGSPFHHAREKRGLRATKSFVLNISINCSSLFTFQIQEKSRAFPLVINGFRANPKDAEGHILFFDVEALVTQMLTEEYSQMSPGTMEVQGFTNQVDYYQILCSLKSYISSIF